MDSPANTGVLIVDDDEAFGAELQAYLAARGYAPSRANNVPDALVLLSAHPPDVCLVDIVMPGTTGKIFCREVVEGRDAAVVMMSSLSDEDTIVSLLEIGADDYLVKPFGLREMLARVRAVLRRRGAKLGRKNKKTRDVGSWEFRIVERQLVAKDGFVRSLTPGETEMLRFLSDNPGAVVSREDLMAVSRTRQHGGSVDRSVDNMIKRLRKKIEADAGAPRLIVTVWGKGYRFDP